MYTQLLPELAAERVRDIRRDATATSQIRLARATRRGHRFSFATSARYLESRLVPRTARS